MKGKKNIWNNWDFEEEEPRKFVKFKTMNTIPKNFEYRGFPCGLIKHGNITYNKNEPIEIVDKYKKWNIVRYTDTLGKIVQLGFKDEDLIFDVNENNFFRSDKKINDYETFIMVVRNHDIIKGNIKEIKYGSNNYNINNYNIEHNKSNFIKPYEKIKFY